MASDLAFFFEQIHRHNQQTLVFPLLESELPPLLSRCTSDSSKGCLLADIGDFLVNVLEITADLAHVLTGKHVIEHTKHRTSSLEQESDFRTLEYLDDKHEALKTINTNIRRIKDSINDIWKETPLPPQPSPSPPPFRPSYPAPTPHRRPQATPLPIRNSPSQSPIASSSMAAHWEPSSNRSSYNYQVEEAASSDNDSLQSPYVDETPSPSLEQLSSRGSGSYTCKYGKECKKGGYENGRIKIFTRNSAYRKHLERHEKPYKCVIPNCGKSFTRPDGLKRHIENLHGQSESQDSK